MTARVTAVSAFGVVVEHGGNYLEVRPTAEGLRFLRNWRDAKPTLRDLLALVWAMARALVARGA